MLVYIFLIAGFFMLIKGADIFVDGSISVARRLHIPSIIIGLTIVAMGTSAPEAAVSITASLRGANGIAVGNIIGSNIFNLLVVVGMCAIIKPIHVERDFLKKDFPIATAAALLLAILGFGFFSLTRERLVGQAGTLTRIDGAILLICMIVFIIYTIRRAKNAQDVQAAIYGTLSLPKTIVFLIIGIAGIVGGGQLTVECASRIAAQFGLSDTLIGLTIVAIGTSLPELVTSIVAAHKGESDIALGNVVGSNIFNTFFILGVTALIRPIPIAGFTIIDIVLSLLVTLLVMVFSCTGKIGRFRGGIMVVLYIVFTVYLILRQMMFGI